MSGPGIAALPEGGRVDFAELRRDRQARLFRAMAEADLDVLLLGRPADIAFASGVRQLWTSGSRPFSPACVVVRADRRIHVLATWDEGVPDEIPHEQLFGLSWSPAIAAEHLRAVPGLGRAQRIGTDGTSASVRRLVASAAPHAELVDARALIGDARAGKSADELLAIETACALAEAGLEAMTRAVRAGGTTRELAGVHAERVGLLGAPVVPDECVAADTTAGFRTVVDDQPIAGDALVALSPSARYAGYDGTIARTVPVAGRCTGPQAELGARCRAALDSVIAACRPGAPGSNLLDAWRAAGGADFPAPLAHGLGLGMEAPLIGMGLGRDVQLRADMVLAVQGWCHDPAVGGWLERDVVLVADVPQILTRGGC